MVTRTKKIFVGGLSVNTTVEDVKQYFEQFGKVGQNWGGVPAGGAFGGCCGSPVGLVSIKQSPARSLQSLQKVKMGPGPFCG